MRIKERVATSVDDSKVVHDDTNIGTLRQLPQMPHDAKGGWV